MDQAIYDPTSGTIVGVKGQWLYQFSATTGAFIRSLRVTKDAVSPSSIASLGTSLYIGIANSPVTNFAALPFTPFNNRDIFIVNPLTWMVTGQFNFGNKNDQTSALGPIGWGVMIAAGPKLFGFNPQTPRAWMVDPTNLPGYTRANINALITDMAYDPVNTVVWMASPGSPNIDIFAVDATAVNGSDCFDTGGVGNVCGITFNNAQNKAYGVDGSLNLYVVSAAGHFPAFTNFPVTTKTLSNINANPVKIKSVNALAANPHNGQVLIPTWNGDSVIIWNPATDLQVTEQLGFSAPYDIVVCPTTNWALQTGTATLKQIT